MYSETNISFSKAYKLTAMANLGTRLSAILSNATVFVFDIDWSAAVACSIKFDWYLDNFVNNSVKLS